MSSLLRRALDRRRALSILMIVTGALAIAAQACASPAEEEQEESGSKLTLTDGSKSLRS